MIPLLLLLQIASPPAPAAPKEDEGRFNRCIEQAKSDPAAAEREAASWRLAGGSVLARQCLGIAYTNRGSYPQAAGAFEDAAREAEVRQDARVGTYWAQAGNAWLAAGDAAKARAALDAALAGGRLSGLALGEAHLDRARALVSAGDLAGGRADIDAALVSADTDPLAWLLSATLARRQGDLDRAQKDITEALRLSSDDASVQLEAGSIAAARGDEAGARSAWTTARRLGGSGAVGTAAGAALAQFAKSP
jgi:tetratricopeptide (TPR) repeat protein